MRGLGKKIRIVRQGDTKRSQQEFADLIGVSQPQVSRWEREDDTPTEPYMERIALEAGMSVQEFLYGSVIAATTEGVPVVSYVGAGERVIPIDSGGYETVNVPAGVTASAELRAMKVRGDSMRPLRDGWLVYYRQQPFPGVDETCFAGPCVLETADGELYIKELIRGSKPGHFHLVSWNQTTAIMQDVAVIWATPVVAMIPPSESGRSPT